jgi:hypothetical protein
VVNFVKPGDVSCSALVSAAVPWFTPVITTGGASEMLERRVGLLNTDIFLGCW